MLFLSGKEICASGVSVMLILCTAVQGTTSNSSRDRWQQGNGCKEGWLQSHNYCLMITDLDEERAEIFCTQHGALQARGICIGKPSDSAEILPPPPSNSVLRDTADTRTFAPLLSSESELELEHECPTGWTAYRDFCYFKPGAVPKICSLLGANYVLDYCVIRLPHRVSSEFMSAIKRLDGDDNNLHRETRLCCCRGGGLCK